VSKIFGRSIRQHGLINNEIPLRRYFLLVGGALLALLFAIDAITPRQPAIDSGNSGPRLPRIRIHSEQKGPEAVVIDTSRPIIVPTLTANGDVPKAVPPPAPQVAENVAQLVSPSLSQTDVKELSKVEPRPHSRRNVGKARTKRPPVSYALRPDIGPFDGWFTIGQQDARIRNSFAQSVPREQRQGRARREVTWARTDNARRPHFGWFDTGW
jgi:hypothetical protein